MNNSYPGMSKKPGMFKSSWSIAPGQYTFSRAPYYLEGDYSAREWQKLRVDACEGVLGAILLALSVTGTSTLYWQELFTAIYRRAFPFGDQADRMDTGSAQLTWSYYARKIALFTDHADYFPPVAPTYLHVYGVSQDLYKQALTVYWHNVHSDYSRPWTASDAEHKALEIARMKQIREAAGFEMERIARKSIGQLKQ